jgi:hypothetical protein
VAQSVLELPGSKLRAVTDEEAIGVMLNHVRRIAPRLNVPMLTPRVSVQGMALAAGIFSEEDGWVKITVDNKFFEDRPAALAILCHELCHYVLSASGIREAETLENERLTDVAMFAFGLGNVFLSGYRRKAGTNYRPGHRLGYLTDAEYEFASQYFRTGAG